jgi:hypothetical protein
MWQPHSCCSPWLACEKSGESERQHQGLFDTLDIWHGCTESGTKNTTVTTKSDVALRTIFPGIFTDGSSGSKNDSLEHSE